MSSKVIRSIGCYGKEIHKLPLILNTDVGVILDWYGLVTVAKEHA